MKINDIFLFVILMVKIYASFYMFKEFIDLSLKHINQKIKILFKSICKQNFI